MSSATNTQSASRALWLFAAVNADGGFSPGVEGLAALARPMARRMDAPLHLMCDVAPSTDSLASLGRHGVSVILPLGAAIPAHPLPMARAALAQTIVESLHNQNGAPPLALLMEDGTFAQVMAPLLCEMLGAALLPGAHDLAWDGSSWVGARDSLGGSLEAVVHFPADSALVATLNANALRRMAMPLYGTHAPPHLLSPPGRVDPAAFPPPPTPLSPDPATLDLADAERIVAFGRGAFAPESQRLVHALAEALGAVVGGTRPAADEGHLPFSRQIGLTGAIVSPRLYVAVGISGAPYHMVGIREAHTLVAINTDPDAPIFQHANLSLVGDLHQIIPRLLEHPALLADAMGQPTDASSPREARQ